MQHPTVTVVIPTFNRLALLRQAVESVKVQTYEDCELLVVDMDPGCTSTVLADRTTMKAGSTNLTTGSALRSMVE